MISKDRRYPIDLKLDPKWHLAFFGACFSCRRSPKARPRAQDAGGQGCSLALLEGLQGSASALAVDALYKSTSDVHCKKYRYPLVN